MLVCEPIVLFLSLLSGFSDALIFTWIKAFALGYSQWGFGTIALGLTFIPSSSSATSSHIQYSYPILKGRGNCARAKVIAHAQPETSPASPLPWSSRSHRPLRIRLVHDGTGIQPLDLAHDLHLLRRSLQIRKVNMSRCSSRLEISDMPNLV